MSEPSGGVKSYETMMAIVRLVASEEGITLSEMADSIDVSKSTIYRHVSTLTRFGFLTHNDGYRLGLALLDLGEKARSQYTIYELAKNKIDEAARTTGENIWLSVEEDGDVVYLYRASGEHQIDTYASVGHRTKPHLLAAGKVILAHMDEQRADEIIADLDMEPNTPHSITEEAGLRAELETVRERGVAYNFQEAAENLNAVAVPVQRPDGGVYGSISIFGPANRLTEEKLKGETREFALRIAEEIKLRSRYG